jgi:hypothetical protein
MSINRINPAGGRVPPKPPHVSFILSNGGTDRAPVLLAIAHVKRTFTATPQKSGSPHNPFF